jgi:hypothetical protein
MVFGQRSSMQAHLRMPFNMLVQPWETEPKLNPWDESAKLDRYSHLKVKATNELQAAKRTVIWGRMVKSSELICKEIEVMIRTFILKRVETRSDMSVRQSRRQTRRLSKLTLSKPGSSAHSCSNTIFVMPALRP